MPGLNLNTVGENLQKGLNLSDLDNLVTALNNLGLGLGNSPAFTGLTLSGLTASKIVVTDGLSSLVSGTNTDAQISHAVIEATRALRWWGM